jgi:hypothetical protein
MLVILISKVLRFELNCHFFVFAGIRINGQHRLTSALKNSAWTNLVIALSSSCKMNGKAILLVNFFHRTEVSFCLRKKLAFCYYKTKEF